MEIPRLGYPNRDQRILQPRDVELPLLVVTFAKMAIPITHFIIVQPKAVAYAALLGAEPAKSLFTHSPNR